MWACGCPTQKIAGESSDINTQGLMGKARDHACAPSRTQIVIMVHDLSRTLNVQKRNIKESPGNGSHILSFIISVFINFSRVLVGNIHHFLYLSSIYPCCQCLQHNLNGRHDSEGVISVCTV